MKFFLLALSWLLLLENLQGSTLSREKPVRALNTTLRTNFSGVYQRKNPCSGTEIETSSYKASHELHHHTRDDGWSDYTHKCSAIIRNFLQTIGNLIRFNNDPNGSFNFYLNTSISQKQRVSGNPKSCENLPTIVIEATDCKIPLGPCCPLPKERIAKGEDAEEGKFRTDRFPGDFSAQQEFTSPTAVPTPQQIPNDPTFPAEEPLGSVPVRATASYPGREWFQAEETTREDDRFPISPQSAPETEFPTAFSSEAPLGEPEDFSQAVLSDLSRDTHSAYEPKTKYFKTSLRLTPQTDPENGTIQPRIHYMAANLVTDPNDCEPQPEPENPSPSSGGPFPLPEGPNQPTERTTPSLPSEYPPQVPPPSVAPVFRPFADQNEPIQVSVAARPEPQFSLPSFRATETPLETTAAPQGEEFTIQGDFLPQPARLSNDPAFTPGGQPTVSRINDPQFSSVPLQPQPPAAVYDRQIPQMQFTPAPQPFDISPTNSKLGLTISSVEQNQSEDGLPPPPRQWPQSQVPQSVPGHPPNVNGDAIEYPLALNPPPLVGDSSFSSESETVTYSDRTPNNPPFASDEFAARQIYQRLPPQLPYDSRRASAVLPPPRDSSRGYESTSLTAQAPSLELQPPPEEESNGASVGIANRPSVTPYGAVLPPMPMVSTPATGMPLSDSLVTPSPRMYEGTGPIASPLEFNAYSGQQPIADGRSQFHSSSLTTKVEETVTETTTPGSVDAMAGRIRETTANNFNPPPYGVPQLPSVLPEYPQSQGATPFPGGNMRDDSQPLMNSDRVISSQLTPESPQVVPKSEIPSPGNVDYSPVESQTSNRGLNSINEQVQTISETTQTIPLPFRHAPEYNFRTDGLPFMTTPMPENTVMNSVPSSSGSPAAAVVNYPDAGLAGAYAPPTYPPGEYNFQTPPQEFSTPAPVLVEEPPIDNPILDYPDRVRAPPASDSLVSGDFPVGASIPGGSLTYDPSRQKLPSVNPETPRGYPDPVGSYKMISTESEQISEDVSSPRPEVYALLPDQQPLGSGFNGRFQQSFPSAGQSYTDRNPAGVFTPTSTFQTPSQSTTPDTEQIVPPLILDDKSAQRTPESLLGSLEEISDGRQTTDSETTPPEGGGYLPAFPDTFPGYVDATTPANFPPPTERPNPPFPLDGPYALPEGVITPPPPGERSPDITSGKPDLQQPEDFQRLPDFHSQQLPTDFPADTSKPELPTIPLAGLSPTPKSPNWRYDDQTPPVSSLTTISSTEDRSIDSLPSQAVDGYGSSLPVTDRSDSPAEYTLPPVGENEQPQFFTSPQPESFGNYNPSSPQPVQSLEESTQMTLQQPPESVPSISIVPQPPSGGLATPMAAPEWTFDQNRPLPSETDSVQPPPVSLEDPVRTQLQEEETTASFAPQPQPRLPFGYESGEYPMTSRPPQAFDGASSGPQPYVNRGSYPQIAFNPQRAPELQETAVLNRIESQSNDFGQNPNTAPVAERILFAADSTPLSQQQTNSYKTATVKETTTTTTTTVTNSDRFSTGSTEVPLLELHPQTRPESIAPGEIITTQQQAFLPPDAQQPPSYAPPSSDESPNSFVPLGSQLIPTPNPQTPATIDRSSQTQSIRTSELDLESNRPLPSTVPMPAVTPGTPLASSDRPTPSREEFQSVVSDSVESLSQEPGEANPIYFRSAAPPSMNAESQTVSQVNTNFQEGDRRRFPEPFRPPVNLQRRPDGQPRPEVLFEFINAPIPQFYSGNPAPPPRTPLPGRYPDPRLNYMQNPVGQQPMPQITESQPPSSAPLNSSPESGSIDRQVLTSSETVTQSSEQFSNPDRQLAVSAERLPAAVSPAYLQNLPNPNGLMPPPGLRQIPAYNAFQPEGQLRYFGPPPPPSYPVNNDPRIPLPNRPNFPVYPNVGMENPAPSRDIPPANQIMDGQIITPPENYPMVRPNFDADPGRQMDTPTEERPTPDSAPGLPNPPEMANALPPAPPAPAPENPLPNPLLQALQSHLSFPVGDDRTSFPGRSDQNGPLPLDNTPAAPPRPGQWNPRPATNFVNLQQNAPLDAPRGVPNGPQPDPHALVPDQTTPSNEPDPASTGRSDHYTASRLRDSFYADRMRSGPERF